MKKNQKILVGSIVAVTIFAALAFVSKDILTSRAGSGVETIEGIDGKNKKLDIKALKSPGMCRKIYLKAEPKINDDAIFKRVLRLCRTSYAAHYDPMVKMPLSITVNLKWSNLKDRTIMPPPAPFKDPDFPIKEIPSADDYLTTGYYQQSFLTDYKDFVKNSNDKWTDQTYVKVNQKTYAEGSYASITFPVVKYNFIEGIWEDLNKKTYKDLEKHKKLTIIMGPVFFKGQSLGILGETKIPIPTHFYKIIYNERRRGASVYVFPNKEIITATSTAVHNPQNAHYCKNAETGAPKYCEIDDFLIKFGDLEALVGQEFLPNLTAKQAVKVKQDINEAIKREEKRPVVPVPELPNNVQK